MRAQLPKPIHPEPSVGEGAMAGSAVYITWVTASLLGGIILMPLFKPLGKRVTLAGFVDMFRRYWLHIALVFSIYVWKDLLDGLDRILMANTQLDMTPFIYAVEGDLVLWVQQTFLSGALTFILTHYYVAGYMLMTYTASLYFTYFDDRWMADRVLLAMFFVYALAVPFYLFFNVRVTGDHIPQMEPLAYHLTPEIQTWFTRIDPFTNGMPSLHIGVPFAVWLGIHRWDEDNRWRNFRIFIGVFTIVTGFTIIYLGIHWFVDILGGLFVAAVAVNLADRSHAWVWYRLDERTFNARLAWLLADLRNIRQVISAWGERVWSWLTTPSQSLTTSAVVVLLITTAGVLLYDAAHQHFPASGVTHPEAAAGSGGWLVALDSDENGNLSAVVMDLEGGESRTVRLDMNEDGNQSQWGLVNASTEVLVSKNHAIISQGYLIRTIRFDNVNQTGIILTGPLFDSLALLDSDESSANLYGVHEGNVYDVINWPAPPIAATDDNITLIDGGGDSLAWVTDDQPLGVKVLTTTGVQSVRSVLVNASVAPEVDEQVLALTGVRVDYSDAEITAISLSGDSMVVEVNLSAVTRLVLVDLQSGEQRLIGDPLFPVAAASIGNDHIAWQHRWGLNSLEPVDADLDWDVSFHVISENRSYPLHTEDELNQTAPQVMERHIAWLQQSEGENPPELRIYSLEETFEPYSSRTLQVAIILLIPLLTVWMVQNQKERRERYGTIDEGRGAEEISQGASWADELPQVAKTD